MENNDQINDEGFINFEAIQSQGLTVPAEPNKESDPNKDGSTSSPTKEEDLAIDPSIVIFILDSLIVRIISFWIAPRLGYRVKPSDISLTAAEIKRIKPYAVKSLGKLIEWFTAKFPEHAALIIILVITYGSKIMDKAVKVEKPAHNLPKARREKKVPESIEYKTKSMKKR